MGNTIEEMLSTFANRLIRLDRQISEKDKMNFAEKANVFTINLSFLESYKFLIHHFANYYSENQKFSLISYSKII